VKKLFQSKKGYTLIELIVAMTICLLLMTSVALLLPSILRVYNRANAIAERSALLNNAANHILSDLADATLPVETVPNQITMFNGQDVIIYTIDGEGVLNKTIGSGEATPVLAKQYYRHNHVSFVCEEVSVPNSGGEGRAYRITIMISSNWDTGEMSRSFMVMPLVLNQF